MEEMMSGEQAAGWLEKKGVLHKTWKRRGFELRGTHLRYSTCSRGKLEGMVDLTTATAVNVTPNSSSIKNEYEIELVCEGVKHGGSQHQDGAHVVHERTYHLRCHDATTLEHGQLHE